MTRVFQSLDFFVLSCVFLTVGSYTGQILPPQNVTLRWKDDFVPEVSWEPPPHSVENCTYNVSVLTKTHDLFSQDILQQSPWSEYPIDDKNENYWLSVETVCNGKHSAPSVIRISNSELVTNVECVILSSKQSRCSWSPISDVPDLGFFYRLRFEDGSTSFDNDVIPPLQACPSYNYTGDRTHCYLQANITQVIHIVLNGTLNNKTVRSTFRQNLILRPPPLNWTVVKNGNKFKISWIPPDIGQLSDWDFKINYTECDEIKSSARKGVTSFELEPASHCQCCMSIKAEGITYRKTKGGETPWSDEKCFGDADTDSLVYVAFVVPLMFAGLAVLTFACCRKNKDRLFPKVPEPRDFLSDISDNNNKGNVRNLYIPAEEEEACKITLVIDPQNNKHDS